MSCSRGCCETQREHYLSVRLSSTCTPSRNGAYRTQQIEATEKRWSKDFAAVKQMKKEGIVPKTTEGAAELLSKANTRLEVEQNKVLDKNQIVQLEHLTETDVK